MKAVPTVVRSFAASVALMAPLFLAGEVHAISSYTVTPLGGLLASRLNSSGDTVGWGTVAGNPRAYVYTPEGGFVYLDLPAGQSISLANDISDRDLNGQVQIVGHAYDTAINEPGTAYRWTYQPGVGVVEVTSLGTVTPDPHSEATGVNASGRTVGYSDPASLFGGGLNAFAYDDANGMQYLGFKGVPQAINNAGQIVGYGASNSYAWRVTNGVFESLGKPLESNIAWAYALSEAGSVAGFAIMPDGRHELARYSDAAGWQLLGGIGSTNIGWGINSAGTVVGEGVAISGQGLRGVIYADDIGRVAYIEDYLQADQSGWNVFAAYDINDAGQIAAYGVHAVTGEGGGLLLQPVGGVLQPPAAPSGLAAVVEVNGVRLNWSDNSDNELVFQIERRLSGTADFAALTTSTFATYHDAGVANCASYDYRVRAYNDAGFSGYSNTVSLPGPCVQPPAAPSALDGYTDLGAVVLDWSDNSDNETNFEIERDDGQGFVTVETATTGNGFVDIDVLLCRIYTYRVRAMNAGGASGYSNSFEIDTPCPPTQDVTAPQISVAAPLDGAQLARADALISASASDNTSIASMAVFVNGQQLCREVRATRIECGLGRDYLPGDYNISVVAIDAEGNEASAGLSITLLEDPASVAKGARQTAAASDAAAPAAGSDSGGGIGAMGWWLWALPGVLAWRRRVRR